MKPGKVLALIALLPAALNVTAASAAPMIALCTGDGQVHLVPLPVGKSRLPGGDDGVCCMKGCHSGTSRKKGLREIEPSQ
ncbi:hypothetical protein ACFFF7_13725 [Novosphingobium aquiterrae]|uniref:Secreted protein n=1 Tax=Novosphingobium aquiterrae TaxID=624388 RepID=A0ABV6PKU1_9SPHN